MYKYMSRPNTLSQVEIVTFELFFKVILKQNEKQYSKRNHHVGGGKFCQARQNMIMNCVKPKMSRLRYYFSYS